MGLATAGELAGSFGAAFVLGFSIGIIPGPVMLLALGQVIQRGWGAWLLIQVATALAWALLAAAILAGYGPLLALPGVRPAIALGGGVVLFLLAGSLWRTSRRPPPSIVLAAVTSATAPATDVAAAPRSALGPFSQGFGASLLNPAAVVFWLTAGAAMLVAGQAAAGLFGIAFVFLGIACGQAAANGVVVVGFVRASRRFGSVAYRRILVALALPIALFGIRMLWDGLR
ncbi:MAG: LysE family transporter [Chloroflexi bacterium]|nr:LysE family transporter [Chloroflexota bacterium]